MKELVIAVVPGHDKPFWDPGAVDGLDPAQKDALYTVEREWTRTYVEALCICANMAGIFARPVTGDVKKTVETVNKGFRGRPFDLAVSIHFNAAASVGAKGIEFWIQAITTDGYTQQSGALAHTFYKQMYGREVLPGIRATLRGLPVANPGTRAHSFLGNVTVPAVLCELGFITNPEDEWLIHHPAYMLFCVSSIIGGIWSCFGSELDSPSSPA